MCFQHEFNDTDTYIYIDNSKNYIATTRLQKQPAEKIETNIKLTGKIRENLSSRHPISLTQKTHNRDCKSLNLPKT